MMMGEYMFGLHSGHLTSRADAIARRHEAHHINYTEPNGRRRGWFACRNLGAPFDQATADAVWRDIEASGGLEVLLCHQDREDTPIELSFVDRRPLHEQRASWDKLRATVKGWRDDPSRPNIQRLKMGDQIAKDRKW